MSSWHYVCDYTLYAHGGWSKKVLFKGWFRSADECIETALKAGAIKSGDLFEVGYNKQVRRAGP